MSIRSILEAKLATISPSLGTVYENLPQSAYVPVAGTPYQSVNMLYADSEDLCITNDMIKDQGIMQVTLYYPLNQGAKNIEDRAKLIRSTFINALTLTDGTDTVKISKTPDIKNMGVMSDRYVYVVSIYYKSYS